MAIVLTGFQTNFVRVPYIKPPDLQRMLTAVPRAIVWFITTAGVVPAKPVNDQQKIQFSLLLPLTFAYRLVNAGLNLQALQAQDWIPNGEAIVTNSMRGQPPGVDTHHPLESVEGSTFATITGVRNYFFPPGVKPTFIMQSIRPNTQAGIDFRFGNDNATAATAGVVNFFAWFYEYDIEQVQLYPPLIPSMVYEVA